MAHNSIMCHVDLPSAGLGNKLLTWAHGVVFAKLNQCDMITTNWVSLHIGPILRRERSYRLYYGYFKRVSFMDRIKLLWLKKTAHVVLIKCSEILKKPLPLSNKTQLYTINKYPDWRSYFTLIREYRQDIVTSFNAMLSDDIKEQYSQLQSPDIGVHIRRGDFNIASKMSVNVPFSEQPCPITSESFFIDTIIKIREVTGKNLKVTVFSDGKQSDFGRLFELPNIKMSSNKSDLLDLLQLSKSKIVVPSPGSTFSLWAAFLSNAIIIKHPAYRQDNIRDSTLSSKEGTISSMLKNKISLLDK